MPMLLRTFSLSSLFHRSISVSFLASGITLQTSTGLAAILGLFLISLLFVLFMAVFNVEGSTLFIDDMKFASPDVVFIDQPEEFLFTSPRRVEWRVSERRGG